jgi:two-component system sensor histidine kinase PilS (NtrC family)
MELSYEDRVAEQQGRNALTWNPLRLLTWYRLILASLLIILFYSIPENVTFGEYRPVLYSFTCFFYLGFSLVMGFMARMQYPRYEFQTTFQILIDIVVITLLTHASGGLASGLGILLIIAVAAGSLLVPGRIAFLFAAVAAMAMIIEQFYSIQLLGLERSIGYTQSGLLGLALFATAILAYFMARRVRESEALARRRGIDIANLSKLNEHIVQRLQAGIIVTDQLHNIRLINATARKLLGIPDNSENRPLAQLAPALHRQLLGWQRSPDKETAPFESAATGTRILPHFTQLGTAEGQGALIFLEDMAAIVSQAQQMKLASLGRLTASIAHEIRNPIGAISHATQLLDESDTIGKQDQRLMTIIGEQTRRVNTIVENILQLSRPGASVPQSIELEAWLVKFIDEFVHSGACDADQLSASVTPRDITAWMDPSQLHQVIWNLCQNALYHGSDEIGSVRIQLQATLSGTPATPQLDIIDNGQGIASDMTDQIFEPFYTTKSSGTGLGLYLARQICEINNARLSYHPAAEGGSCFRITFPENTGPAVSITA